MYKNFNITAEERQQIMEMHKSHGYKQLINEQDAATTSIYKGYIGLGTDEDELVKGFSSIKSVDQYKKVEGEIAKYGGYATLQDVLNGELSMDDYDTANKIYKHLNSISGIEAVFSYRLHKPTGDVTFEVGTYKITLSAPEVSNDAPNWDKVVNYLKTNKFPPNYTSKIEVENNDDGSTFSVHVYDSQGKRIRFWDDGEVSANKKEGGDVFRLGKWTWDGTKPVIPSWDITNPTKSAAGYAQNEDDLLKNNKILGIGSRNDLVKKIQGELYSEYEDEINAKTLPNPGCSVDADENTICDGIYGQKTKQLVSRYQEDNGLNKDGYVGNETYRAMF
jgi:hypothetical protein